MESSHLVAMADGVPTPGKRRGADWRTELAGELVVSTDPAITRQRGGSAGCVVGVRTTCSYGWSIISRSSSSLIEPPIDGVPMALVVVVAGANRGTLAAVVGAP